MERGPPGGDDGLTMRAGHGDGAGPEAAEVIEVVEVGGPKGGSSEATLGHVFGLGCGGGGVIVAHPLVAVGCIGSARFSSRSLPPAFGLH